MKTFQYKSEKEIGKVQACDLSQRIFPVERLAYDENHRLVIIQDGERDVQAEIEANASRVIELSELCAGFPGDSPLEQLNYAIENGIIQDVPKSDVVNDFTGLPSHISDIANTGNETRAMLGGQKGNLEELINAMVKEALAKQADATKAEAKEGDK